MHFNTPQSKAIELQSNTSTMLLLWLRIRKLVSHMSVQIAEADNRSAFRRATNIPSPRKQFHSFRFDSAHILTVRRQFRTPDMNP